MNPHHRLGIYAVLVVCSFILGTKVEAQTYTCLTNDQTRFFTNDPAFLPPDCSETSADEVIGSDRLSVTTFDIPDAPLGQNLLTDIKERKGQVHQSLEEWKNTARQLVSQYQATRKTLYQPISASSKIQLRKELRDIKERRDALLAEVAAAKLPFRDRGAIAELLTAIPQD